MEENIDVKFNQDPSVDNYVEELKKKRKKMLDEQAQKAQASVVQPIPVDPAQAALETPQEVAPQSKVEQPVQEAEPTQKLVEPEHAFQTLDLTNDVSEKAENIAAPVQPAQPIQSIQPEQVVTPELPTIQNNTEEVVAPSQDEQPAVAGESITPAPDSQPTQEQTTQGNLAEIIQEKSGEEPDQAFKVVNLNGVDNTNTELKPIETEQPQEAQATLPAEPVVEQTPTNVEQTEPTENLEAQEAVAAQTETSTDQAIPAREPIGEAQQSVPETPVEQQAEQASQQELPVETVDGDNADPREMPVAKTEKKYSEEEMLKRVEETVNKHKEFEKEDPLGNENQAKTENVAGMPENKIETQTAPMPMPMGAQGGTNAGGQQPQDFIQGEKDQLKKANDDGGNGMILFMLLILILVIVAVLFLFPNIRDELLNIVNSLLGN